MSIGVMKSIWDDSLINEPRALLILLALSDWANEDGWCWPAIKTIAKRARTGERTAQRLLGKLEKVGAIQVIRGTGRNNTSRYRVVPPQVPIAFELRVPTDQELGIKGDNIMSPFDEMERVTSVPVKGDIQQQRVTSRAQKGVKAVSPEPTEPTVEPKTEPKRDLPIWIPKESWDGFVEMRNKIREPLTPRGKMLIWVELEKLRDKGYDPGEVLDRSVMHNWKGVFPLKGDFNGKNQSAGFSGSGQPSRAEQRAERIERTGKEALALLGSSVPTRPLLPDGGRRGTAGDGPKNPLPLPFRKREDGD